MLKLIEVTAYLLQWQGTWSWQVLSKQDAIVRDPVVLALALLRASEADRVVVRTNDSDRVIARAKWARGRTEIWTWSEGDTKYTLQYEMRQIDENPDG